MDRKPVGLPVPFIPREAQPVEAFFNRLQRLFRIALDVGIVDAENHGSAPVPRKKPVEDKGPRPPMCR